MAESWYRIAAVLIASACCSYAAQDDDSLGKVRLLVMDTHGNPIPHYQIEVSGDSKMNSFQKTFTDVRELQLPTGRYRLRATATLHHSTRRELHVRNEASLLVLALAFRDPGESEQLHSSTMGRILTHSQSSSGLWIRMISLFGDLTREVEVRKNGTFEVPEVPFGHYIVLVAQDFRIVKVQRFTKTPREEELTVDLDSK